MKCLNEYFHLLEFIPFLSIVLFLSLLLLIFLLEGLKVRWRKRCVFLYTMISIYGSLDFYHYLLWAFFFFLMIIRNKGSKEKQRSCVEGLVQEIKPQS